MGGLRRELGGLIWLIPVGLVLAIIASVAALSVAPATYTAERQVLFLSKPTAHPDIRGEVNPFLELGPSLYSAGEVMAISVSDERTAQQIAPDGSNIEYAATMLPGSSSPILVVNSEAPSATEADSTVDQVVAQVGVNLQSLQESAKAPKNTWIVSTLVASSDKPRRDLTRTLVLAGGAFVVVLGAFLVSLATLVGARRSRRAAKAPGEPASNEPS